MAKNPLDLRSDDVFMTTYQPPEQREQAAAALAAAPKDPALAPEYRVEVMCGSHLPIIGKGKHLKAAKAKKMRCICSVQGKTGDHYRMDTGLNEEGDAAGPVWKPGATGNTLKIEDGESLNFIIETEGNIALAEGRLPHNYFKNGYEWWLPLTVHAPILRDMGETAYPYAAIQVKVSPAVQVDMASGQDPFLAKHNTTSRQGGICRMVPTFPFFYLSCCQPCIMGLCRFFNVCLWSCAMTSSWLCGMTCTCLITTCSESCTALKLSWRWCTGENSLNELRQEQAKRLKLKDADDDMDDSATACCCIPLRTAVFLISVFTFIKSAQALFFPGFFQGDMTRFCGGYGVLSRVVVGATQITGLLFGPIGAVGAWELSVSLLSMYNLYQFLRLVGMCTMLYTDIPLLLDCNTWRTDIDTAIATHGWNPAMYNVAMGNNCLQAQIDFSIGTVFHLLMYIYLISLTRRLIWDTEQTPKYLLALPRDMPSGAFVKHNRTQGRAKAPYGSFQNQKADTGETEYGDQLPLPIGKRAAAGIPHAQGGKATHWMMRPFQPTPLPPHMLPPIPGGRAPRDVWHPNAMPQMPGMLPPRMQPMPEGMAHLGPGMMTHPQRPIGSPPPHGFKY